jgi:putative YhbY family RNA-binding protein
MSALTLDPDQRRALRARAHHLHPVVMVGAEGLSDAVLREADAALNALGLIKVRVASERRAEREELLKRLAQTLGAAAVQHIGRLLVLWRPLPEPTTRPDTGRMPGPRTVKVVKPTRSPTHRPTVRKVRVLGNQRVTAGGLVKRKRQRAVSPKKRPAG